MKRKIKIRKFQTGGLNYMDTTPQMMTPRGVNQQGQVQQLQSYQIPNEIPQYQGNDQQSSQQGFSNTMNSAGKFGGMIGSGYYGSQQAVHPGDDQYNKTMAGVSQAGPIGGVIGGVSAIGDSIGAPIRKHAEAQNELTGKYENAGGAYRGNVAGSMLNPYKALTTVSNDPYANRTDRTLSYINMAIPGVSAFGMKGYTKRHEKGLEGENMTKHWNQSLASNSLMRQNNPQYNYNPTFATGGDYPGVAMRMYPYGGYYADGGIGANAELEDNEIFRTPDGDMNKVNGRTHAEGGEQMNLPQNTEILGKNIAPNGISYKKNGDRLFRQFNKYNKILEDKPTSLAKKTANMMLDKVHKEYSNLMNMQEKEKQMQQMNQMFVYGGLTMYPMGGVTEPEYQYAFSGLKGQTSKYKTPEQDWQYGAYQKEVDKRKPELKDKSELYYYSNILNNKLKEKNPTLYTELISKYGYNPNQGFNKQVSPKTRTTGADSYASKNPNFYLDSNEQQKLLGDKWQRYNELRGKYGKDLNLVGKGDDPNKPETWKVGARHAVAFNPASYEYTKVPSPTNKRDFTTSDFTYNVNYDPNNKNPYDESLNYMSQETPPMKAYGGLIKYDSGGTYRNDYGKYIDKGLDTPRYDYPYNGLMEGNNEYGLYGESNGLANYVDYSDINPNDLYSESNNDIELYKRGGIHINPANKGKFNALKARTGKTTAQLTHSSNPLTRKRAIFAQNAKKWRHEDGGMINNTGYLKGSQTDTNPMNIIPSNYITTNGMSRPITAMSDTGDQRNLYPNTGNYAFGGNYVMEKPMYQDGGTTDDIYLNKQPNYRGFVSPQDARTANNFFGNDTPDIMETRQGAPRTLKPRGFDNNGNPLPIRGDYNQQLSATNNYDPKGENEHTRFIDETPDAWYNKAFDTVGQYAPMSYNMYQGMFGKPEHMNASDYDNPYENQVMSLMRGRRYNVDPELESNRLASADYYHNLRQGAPSQGRYLAGLQAGQIGRQRGDAEAYARKQNIDNQYLGEEASTLGGFGNQKANMRFQVDNINAQNRAFQKGYIPTALTQLQQQTQMNKIMREKQRLMKNQALRDEERQRIMENYFKGYNFNLGGE
jgi:hypothetical protein